MELEKITNIRQREPKRRYDDACGTAHGLELIGERWALLVLRELMLGSRRFSQLREDLPGISANVLTQRLAEMEERGLVVKKRLPPPANVQVYEATEWGLEAEPIVQTLGRWAARSPQHDPTLPISGVSILLSFRTMINERKAKGIDARIGFVFGGDSYVARLKKGKIKVTRGETSDVDLLFQGDPSALAAIIYGDAPYELMKVSGDMELADRFKSLFVLPPKAAITRP